MVIGKWNKSVWLSYAGVGVSCAGIFLAIVMHEYAYACICLIIAGICDMLDGFVARLGKNRSVSDRQFGIELDSVADVVDFVALPIAIVCAMDMKELYELVPVIVFAVCGVARLAYYNTVALKNDKPVQYYHGLPVTFTAMIFPICFLAFMYFIPSVARELLLISMTIIGFLNILDIHVVKPKPKIYGLFIVLAIIVSILLVAAL